MTCVDHNETKPLIYEKLVKENNCIRTNNMLEIESCI